LHPLSCCPAAGHNYIGTEHILLGLLREGEGVAARVLETLGADPSKIRTQVRVCGMHQGLRIADEAGLHSKRQHTGEKNQQCFSASIWLLHASARHYGVVLLAA
jgi:ATP-dependent Clp protease ATP-binding subunit ClpA